MSGTTHSDDTSRVPRFTFAGTLPEQRAHLEQNPLMARLRQSRQALASDPYRPLCHFVSPEGRLNDPNGLCFWRGQWHLFYQAQPPDEPRWHWGHTVSEDLIHWRDLPYAIYPNPEEGCWSGSTWVEEDRVIAMYHGHLLGNMVAVSRDPLLLNWEKVTGTTVIPNVAPIWEKITGKEGRPRGSVFPVGAINTVYDPCIWKKNGVYYSLSGGTIPHGPSGKRLRNAFLFRSTDLATWEYLHPFIEGDVFGLTGDDAACPYFWPLGDRHILIHFSHMSGSKYLIGDYDTARDTFTATAGGAFTFGAPSPSGVHAPSTTPDGRGGLVAMFNINAGKPTTGWNQIMSLPRRLTLADNDELNIEPAGDIESLRHDHQTVAPMPLPANREVVLEQIRGNAVELVMEIDPKNAAMVELNVLRSPGREEYTRIVFFKRRGYRNWERCGDWGSKVAETTDSLITLDTSYSSELPDVASRAPEIAPVYVKAGEPLKLRVFIDRSVVEVFVNGRQCVAVRAYPGRADSLGVSLRAQGQDAMLNRLDAWQLRSIWPSRAG